MATESPFQSEYPYVKPGAYLGQIPFIDLMSNGDFSSQKEFRLRTALGRILSFLLCTKQEFNATVENPRTPWDHAISKKFAGSEHGQKALMKEFNHYLEEYREACDNVKQEDLADRQKSFRQTVQHAAQSLVRRYGQDGVSIQIDPATAQVTFGWNPNPS